jgi:hypothetical protein
MLKSTHVHRCGPVKWATLRASVEDTELNSTHDVRRGVHIDKRKQLDVG